MPLSSQGITARWLLFMAALATFPYLPRADDNFADFDWLNKTQLLEMFDYENITEWNSTESDVDVDASWESPHVNETVVESVGETVVKTVGKAVVDGVVEKSKVSGNGSGNVDFSFEKLRQHRHYTRIVLMVVLLHVAVVGVCIAIYSLIYCKMRSLKKLQRANAQRCLRLLNLQSQHVPNSRDCSCSGCTMAREMLQDLYMQHLHEVVEC